MLAADEVPSASGAVAAPPTSPPQRVPVTSTGLALEPIPRTAASAARVGTEVVAVTMSMVNALLDTGNSDGMPIGTPVDWVLLAAARRKLADPEAPDPTLAGLASSATTGDPLLASEDGNRAPIMNLSYVRKPGWITGKVSGDVNTWDPDWDRYTYATSAPTKGSVRINRLGQFTYTPTATARHAVAANGASEADRTDTFTVTATDIHGAATTLTVAVTIGSFNRTPSARVVTVSDPEPSMGMVVGVVTATDRDGDTLTFSGPTSTRRGAVVVNTDGTFAYTPTAEARQAARLFWNRSDSFRVAVTDGHGGTDSVLVRVAITPAPANIAPGNGLVRRNPADTNGVVTGSVSASDADGDILSYTGSTTTAKGTASVNADGTFTYTPTGAARHAAAAANAASTGANRDSFTVTVSDGRGGTLKVPVSIDISPQNTAPTGATATAGTAAEDGAVTGSITATDPENDTLTYALGTTGPARGEVTVNANGTFSYRPTVVARHAAAAVGAPEAVKNDAFSVIIRDGHGGVTTLAVPVTVSPLNANPEITGQISGVPDADGLVIGTVTATDRDGDSLVFSGPATSVRGGVVTVEANGSFSYRPSDQARLDAAQTSGADTDSFTVTVTDGHGGTAAALVTVVIAPAPTAPNSAPTAGNDELNTAEDNAVTVSAATLLTNDSDPEGGNLPITAVSGGAHGTTSLAADGTVTYTPAANFHGTDTFTYTVTDGALTGTASVAVAVAPVNDPPVIGSAAAGLPGDDGVVTGKVVATDIDGDPLTYSGPANSAKGGLVTVNYDGTFSYRPTDQARADAAQTPGVDTDTFAVTVTDGRGGTATRTVSVTVAPAEQPGTTQGVAGTPVGSLIVGKHGYSYQMVARMDPDTGQFHSAVVIRRPNGSTAVSGTLPGTPVISSTLSPVPRADGSIVVLVANGSTATLVKVAATGATSVIDTLGSNISALWADDGTVFVVQPIEKTVTFDGRSVQRPSFEIRRHDTAGVLSVHTYDTGPQQFAGLATSPSLGANGTLYVGFTNYTDPTDFLGSISLIGHAAVLAVPTTGDAQVIPVTALTGSDFTLGGNTLTVRSTADGGVFVAASTFNGGLVVVIGPDGAVTRTELPNGIINALEAGGHNAVVTWRAVDTVTGEVSTQLSFINARGVAGSHPWIDGQAVLVGPNGTAYSFSESDGQRQLTIITPTSISYQPWRVPTLSGNVGGLQPLQFGADGTAFLLEFGEDNSARIKVLPDGATSPTVAAPASIENVIFRVIDDIAVLVTNSSAGAHVVAIDSAGTVVAQQTIPNPQGQQVQVGAVTVGPNGALYVATISAAGIEGGTPTFASTVLVLDGTTSETVASQAGALTTGLAFTATGDLQSTTVTIDPDEQSTTVTLGVVMPAKIPVPNTITRTLDPVTGVVSGSVTADPSFGTDVQYSGSTSGPLGTVVVHADGSYTYTPSAAARDYVRTAGKVANTIFFIKATNGDGESIAIPVNAQIAPSNFPTTTIVAPIRYLDFVALPGGVPPGPESGYSSTSGHPILEYVNVGIYLEDGRNVLVERCTAGDPCKSPYAYTVHQVTRTQTPKLVVDPVTGQAVVPDAYLLTTLRDQNANGFVLGARKMNLGDTVTVKNDAPSTSPFIEHALVLFLPGTFPTELVQPERIPGLVAGYIFDNEVDADRREAWELDWETKERFTKMQQELSRNLAAFQYGAEFAAQVMDAAGGRGKVKIVKVVGGKIVTEVVSVDGSPPDTTMWIGETDKLPAYEIGIPD